MLQILALLRYCKNAQPSCLIMYQATPQYEEKDARLSAHGLRQASLRLETKIKEDQEALELAK